MATAGLLSGLNQAARESGLFGSGSNTPLATEGAQIASGVATVSGIVEGIATASTTVGAIGGGVIGSFAAMAGPIGLAVAAVLIILGHVFHGADPNQVPAAQIEQCFEAAGDNLRSLVIAGYISSAEATLGCERLIQAGYLYYQQAVASNSAYRADPRPFNNGQTNMTKVLTNEIAAITPLPVIALIPWDEAAAQSLYIQDGAAGWYSQPGQSIDAATGLTNGFVEALRAGNPVTTAPAQAATVAAQSPIAPVSATALASIPTESEPATGVGFTPSPVSGFVPPTIVFGSTTGPGAATPTSPAPVASTPGATVATVTTSSPNLSAWVMAAIFGAFVLFLIFRGNGAA